MSQFSKCVDRVVDSHVHLRDIAEIDDLVEHCRKIGFARMNLACYANSEAVNENASGFAAAARYPDVFTMFAGLDHSTYWSKGKTVAPTFPEQVDTLRKIGARGIKMLETKPTSRQDLPIAIDDDYFEPFFAAVEENGMPMLWHAADPEEFWDAEKTPEWAASRGWGYDETDVPKETLYAEVERVLARHPRMNVILAHFYFLSADLPRAAAFLDTHDRVLIDLAPGIEMLHNCSTDPAASREFFCRYAEQIVYGTDIASSQTQTEAYVRADLVRRWLETDEVFVVPEEADFLLGGAGDGKIVGMALPTDVLEQIYAANFERLIGPEPSQIDTAAAEAECRRLAGIVAAKAGKAESETEAARAANMLATM